MRMLDLIMDALPETVLNCLLQEIPQLEVVMNPGHPPVNIREHLVSLKFRRNHNQRQKLQRREVQCY